MYRLNQKQHGTILGRLKKRPFRRQHNYAYKVCPKHPHRQKDIHPSYARHQMCQVRFLKRPHQSDLNSSRKTLRPFWLHEKPILYPFLGHDGQILSYLHQQSQLDYPLIPPSFDRITTTALVVGNPRQLWTKAVLAPFI